jgi:PAS domain S-box-containing protein
MHVATVSRDLGEARAAQAALRISEERLRQAVRVTQIGIYDHDQRADTLYWSPEQRSIFGFGVEEPVTLQGFLECLYAEDGPRIGEAVQRAHDPAGDGTFDIEYRIVRRDGAVRWISNRGQTFFEGEGAARRPVRSVGAIADITDRHKAEEDRARLQAQLAHAQRLDSLGRLAGGVAHDFNNMLHVIIGFAELLRARVRQDEVLSGHVGEIERAARRAGEVTRQLLAFSRKQVISPVPSNLGALVAGTAATLGRLIGEDIALRVVADEGLWTVNVDPAQVDQILINLAVNARDAMPGGGKLTIETANVTLDEAYCRSHVGATPGQYVVLAVSDDGVGMDGETLSHLFEPFFTTKEVGKGTGLGLATIHGIVEQSRGFINVYSEVGRGTTIKIYLPRGTGGASPVEQPPEPLGSAGGGRVLVVEDDESVRRLTAAIVESLGYQVIATGSPAEAIELCAGGDPPIDVVLTDVIMPGISGKELRARLQSLRPGLKVVFTSAYTANVVANQGILEEDVSFIPKPFGMTDLARKLREALAK